MFKSLVWGEKTPFLLAAAEQCRLPSLFEMKHPVCGASSLHSLQQGPSQLNTNMCLYIRQIYMHFMTVITSLYSLKQGPIRLNTNMLSVYYMHFTIQL